MIKGRRKWIKLYAYQTLYGTMMDEMPDPAERWVWIGFLLLAGDSPFQGKIGVTSTVGYSDDQLASMLKCEVKTVTDAKAKMVKYEKIEVLPNGVIKILNWKKYQSDWDRQVAAKKRKTTLKKFRTSSKTLKKTSSKTAT